MKVIPNLNEVELVPTKAVGNRSICAGCVFYYPSDSHPDCITSDSSCVRRQFPVIWKEKVNVEA